MADTSVNEIIDHLVSVIKKHLYRSNNCKKTLSYIAVINALEEYRGQISPDKLMAQNLLRQFRVLVIEREIVQARKISAELRCMLNYLSEPETQSFNAFYAKLQQHRTIDTPKLPDKKRNDVRKLLNSLRIFVTCKKIEKAKKVVNMIARHSGTMSQEEMSELLKIIEEMQNIPEPSKEVQVSNDVILENNIALAACITARCYLENRDGLISEVAENIDYFVKQAQKRSRFNDSLVGAIASVIINNPSILDPYRKSMEEIHGE